MRIADDVIDLGLPEHLVDRDAERFLRPFEQRRSNRLARAHDAPHVDVEDLARLRFRLHDQLERRRNQKCIANLITLDQSQRALRIEPTAIAQYRLTEVERRQQRVHQAAGPRPIRWRPEHVAGLREAVVRVREAGQVA